MTKIVADRLESIGLTQADIRDLFLRKFQRVFDKLAFDNPDWPLAKASVDFRFAKAEYIGNHIGKALGKVLRLENDAAGSDVAVRHEAFPDTLIYRTQLANTLRYDLKKHLGSTKSDSRSLIEADDLLTDARVAIDTFDERIDHGIYLPKYMRAVKEVAIPSLHFAGLIMANVFDEDPREAHADRLVQQLRLRTTAIA